MPKKNGQMYSYINSSLVEFINGLDFSLKNNSEIAREAGLTARTVARAMTGGPVNFGTAKVLHRLCAKQGYKGSIDQAFNQK